MTVGGRVTKQAVPPRFLSSGQWTS